MIELVIIDSTIISETSGKTLDNIEKLISKFQEIGIKVALVSTNAMGMIAAGRKSLRISFNYTLSGEEVYNKAANKFKGGGERITAICSELNCSPSKTLYIGDDRYDYASAVHAGSFFILATWHRRNSGLKCIYATLPSDIWRFSSHYLLHSPRWTFSIDLPEEKFQYRGLLSSNTKSGTVYLPGNSPNKTYTIIDLLKNNNGAKCGSNSSAAILFLHAMTSAKLEGLIPEHSVLTVYPSSTPGKFNPVVQEMSQIASRQFPTHFHSDLIMRAVQASKSRENKLAGLDSYLVQTNTVHLNPDKQAAIKNRTIIVFDDFHTTGKSLDWARNLLISAGAEKVIAISLGKFGSSSSYPHEFYRPESDSTIEPYINKQYSLSDFSVQKYAPQYSTYGRPIILNSFAKLLNDQPY